MSDGANVYRTLFDGTRERLYEGSTAIDAVRRARANTNSPAARLGLVTRVHVVGGDGYTIFDWRNGPEFWLPSQVTPRAARLALSLADTVAESSVISAHDKLIALVAVIGAIGEPRPGEAAAE